MSHVEEEEGEGFFFAEEEELQGEEEEEPVYDASEFISEPWVHGDLPLDIVDFNYSFGYDCKRFFNLSVIDETVVIYASGSLIHFFDTNTGRKWFRRCYSGVGIGHITTNPVEPHVAVAERGTNPHIIIYDWPNFDIVTILRRGTKTAYSHINYSTTGELFCSQGSTPDFMLTVWNWRRHRIMLRAKAFGQEIFNARFSLYVPSHLTTSGSSHLRFWKMARTFTGLKLQGELGRFGKSEICNIVGFLALPDEKVVSGCEWGNILVWDEGLIRVEVFRRGRLKCHDAPITQLFYDNGELTTVGMDGAIKVWYYETIEMADPPEEDRFIEVEPIFEYEVGDFYHKAELMTIVKCNKNEDNYLWFGQDGNGGIWKLELSTALNAKKPKKVFECHAGAVVALQASPFSSHVASLGRDGHVFVYDYQKKEKIFDKEFFAGGVSLLWIPLQAESSGSLMVGGFDDGVIRVMAVSVYEYQKKQKSPSEEYINLVQVSKPHTKAVTMVTCNPAGTILATASEDCTVFIYEIRTGEGQFPEMFPIGFTLVEGPVTCFSWKPEEKSTILIGCSNGFLMELNLPTLAFSECPVSFLLSDVPTKTLRFVSVKSEIRRDLRLQEIEREKEEWLENRKLELAQLYEDKPGVFIDEELFFEREDEEKEPELPPIYVPDVPGSILFAVYTPADTIWLSMSGYDAGYMYEYQFGIEGPVQSTMVYNADDIEIHSCQYYHNNAYLILGMDKGVVRVVKVNEKDHTDLSNYWELTMHDNFTGIITQIVFSSNYRFLFTCGQDGNVFSYNFNSENDDYLPETGAASKGFPTVIVEDIDDRQALSLEQAKAKIEYDRRMRVANAYKRDVLEKLKKLKKSYEALLKANKKLPKSQMMSQQELILDGRLVEDLTHQLEQDMALVKRKIQWHVEKSRMWFFKLRSHFIDDLRPIALKVTGIHKTDWVVATFRQRILGPDFDLYSKLILIAIEEFEARGRAHERLFSEEEVVEVITRRPNPVTALMKQIMSLCGDFKRNIKLRRMLRKYSAYKDRLEDRRIEWVEMMKKRPDPTKLDPADIAAIAEARATVGDYKLKTASDYKVPKHLKLNTVNMYNVLLHTRKEIFDKKDEYNQRVLDLRDRKVQMIKRHEYLRDRLLEIAKEIPKSKVRPPPLLPKYVEATEYPEKNLMWTDAGVFDELPNKFQQLYAVKVEVKKEIPMLDREHEMLLLEKRGLEVGKVHSKLSLLKYAGITGAEDILDLEGVAADDQTSTPWEKETRKLRVIKRLYEQDGIIDEMETGIREFDEDVFNLHEQRVQVEMDTKLLELSLLTVHQEVLILKKFEAKEDEKLNKVYEKLAEKYAMQKKMNEMQAKIDGKWRDIRRYEENIKNLTTMFHATIADQKFFDFLRRIYKKKYRPPKLKTDDSDSDSESDSESESEEEDAKSLDSKDLGPIRLDENVCPAGCDVELYKMTFSKRTERHTMELAIIEEKRQIDLLKKEIEALIKKIRGIDVMYNIAQKDLEDYQREKQEKLNEVETVVVVRMNQIQNFLSPTEMEKLQDSVCFSQEALSKLYQRVGELEKDTTLQKAKHAKNKQHLMRLKVDIRFMQKEIASLEQEIKYAMIRKFGTVVDIDEIQESLLKRLVAEMTYIITEMEREFYKRLKEYRDKLKERKETLTMKLQENTERYNILTVLEEEKIRLGRVVSKQEQLMAEARPDMDPKDVEDVRKLERIAKMQEDRITTLRLEIRMLRLKTRPVAPIIGLYATDVPETVQRILVRGCQGEKHVITSRTKEVLKDIQGEAAEIVQDIREGTGTEEDYERLRQLSSQFFGAMPEESHPGIVQRLSERNIIDEEAARKASEGHLEEVVESLPAEAVLETVEITGELADSIEEEGETKE